MKEEGRIRRKKKSFFNQYILITFAVLLIMGGSHFFKFPNEFVFGGVTGLSITISKISPISPGVANFILNGILLIIGFVFLGKDFGVKTVYTTIFMSVGLVVMDHWMPVNASVTGEPMLDLVYSVLLPAAGSAILFHEGASSGGTDIIAMIIQKYRKSNVGLGLLWTDALITLSAVFVLSNRIFLYSVLGMLTKSLVIDNLIESMNRCKYFHVICQSPEPICNYITDHLHRSATICQAEGAYSHTGKSLVMTVMKPYQAKMLQRYIEENHPDAFLTIIKTSEIFGKGFVV
ncbi:MAG: YitT family protein [Clostridiales bacterium]|nr:YitT family protein [Clostridiales bacterium]